METARCVATGHLMWCPRLISFIGFLIDERQLFIKLFQKVNHVKEGPFSNFLCFFADFLSDRISTLNAKAAKSDRSSVDTRLLSMWGFYVYCLWLHRTSDSNIFKTILKYFPSSQKIAKYFVQKILYTKQKNLYKKTMPSCTPCAMV